MKSTPGLIANALHDIAFDPNKNPLNVPIVQVSLYDSEDLDQHYRLGRALEGLRDEGILIVGAGMAVHNTRDFRRTMGTGETMPYVNAVGKYRVDCGLLLMLFSYTISFDEALKEAVTSRPEERQTKMAALLRRSDARQAHPSIEHLLPIYVAAGAAGTDVGEAYWNFPEGSLSWSDYRFGKINVE